MWCCFALLQKQILMILWKPHKFDMYSQWKAWKAIKIHWFTIGLWLKVVQVLYKVAQTGLLPLSALFVWVFNSFYSTGSTESFFKEKVAKSYQCPLKDLLLRLHIFFLKLNLTRPNWKVFLSSGPEPSSHSSPSIPAQSICPAKLQCLPVLPSHQPRLYW